MEIIGHRGACGYKDENTIESFKKALELNVKIVEFDIYKCKSGEFVVHHDIILDNLTNGSDFIEEKTLDEIKFVRTKSNLQIPTLKEVLDLIDKKCIVNIELKSRNSIQDLKEIIDYYVQDKGWSHDHFIVSSFFHEELINFNKLQPNIKISFLIGHAPVSLKFLENTKPYSVGIDSEFIYEELVEMFHKENIKVFAFTINTKFEFEYLKSIKVDGVFSNYPDILEK